MEYRFGSLLSLPLCVMLLLTLCPAAVRAQAPVQTSNIPTLDAQVGRAISPADVGANLAQYFTNPSGGPLVFTLDPSTPLPPGSGLSLASNGVITGVPTNSDQIAQTKGLGTVIFFTVTDPITGQSIHTSMNILIGTTVAVLAPVVTTPVAVTTPVVTAVTTTPVLTTPVLTAPVAVTAPAVATVTTTTPVVSAVTTPVVAAPVATAIATTPVVATAVTTTSTTPVSVQVPPVQVQVPNIITPVNVPVAVPKPVQVSVPNPRPVAVQVPVTVPVPVPKTVTVPVPAPRPITVSVPVPKPMAVPVPAPRPYMVSVPVPKPVTVSVPNPKPVAVQVPVAVPVPIANPKPIAVQVPVSVAVPKPIAVQVPVAVPILNPRPVAVAVAAIPVLMPNCPSPIPLAYRGFPWSVSTSNCFTSSCRLTYSLGYPMLFPGIQIDPYTGTITGVPPGYSQSGTVTVIATDCTGATATLQFRVTVLDSRPP